MAKITWQVGDGKVHEIPEGAVVTFYYGAPDRYGNPCTESKSFKIKEVEDRNKILFPELLEKIETVND